MIDEPVAPGAPDNLDINIHSRSLIKFIKQTNTPITVGIQGEWGSGKTSLINSIYHEYSSDHTFKQIWINSWEYSLLSTPEEALLKIINRIIEELLDSDPESKRKDAIKSGAEKIFKGALRVGAQVALGTEAAKVTEELLGSAEQGISALRKQLTDLVGDISKRESSPVERIVIYVDDLDRIEPRNAVAILELLKNIFSVPNCVFILAIDYQVVVKGLEHKFGKQTPENEWEFKAFFDKIIQLPFMMPMGQYNIGKYVNALLVDVGFVEVEGLDADAIREIIRRTIGGNPRSIKRLVNSVALIQIFAEEKSSRMQNAAAGEESQVEIEETELDLRDEKFLLFSLLCLQIAYPPIYSLLNREPDFTKWDDRLAMQETKRSEEDKKDVFDREYENAQQTDDFNEAWEKALYRICYGRPRMKARVADISKFFSYIKDDLLSGHQETIGETVAVILSQTSVTSVTSTDQGQATEMTQRSKRVNTGQMDILVSHTARLFAELKTAGSIVFGTSTRTNNITGAAKTRKKGLFADPDFTPRWHFNFAGHIEFGLDGEAPEDNLEVVKYFESILDSLREQSQLNLVADWKEDRKRNRIYIRSPLFDRKTFSTSVHLAECDDRKREETISWAVENVPKFEQLAINVCNEYFQKQ